MSRNRTEAFSDAVIAIIITIMVLEMRAPHGTSLGALRPMLPVFLSYLLSFIYLGIYWNNRHHLLHAGWERTASRPARRRCTLFLHSRDIRSQQRFPFHSSAKHLRRLILRGQLPRRLCLRSYDVGAHALDASLLPQL